MDLKWKDPTREEPQLGRNYITVDADGKMTVRRYACLKEIGETATGRKKYEIAVINPDVKGFISSMPEHRMHAGTKCFMATRVVFYMELPDIPDLKKNRARAEAEIRRLQSIIAKFDQLEESKGK